MRLNIALCRRYCALLPWAATEGGCGLYFVFWPWPRSAVAGEWVGCRAGELSFDRGFFLWN